MTRVPTHRLSPATGATSTADDEDWRHRAACRSEDPELFWPDGYATLDDRMQIATAKAVCGRCPVRPTCLQGALERRDTWGIWGGELFTAGIPVRDQTRRRPATPRPTEPRPDRVRDECGTGPGLTLHRRHNERRCRACLDHDTAQRIRRFTETVGDAAALADAGHTLDEAAAILGTSPDELARALRPEQYPVLARLRRNPGAQQN